ncbi:MAG TPA: hypothetical protein VHB51_03070 [Candidatus Saccharimonadales bacterium]|nr:hypothetical protein [Candidatus Saccharimonadales bacterium]
MAKKKKSKKSTAELDSVYLLKLVLYLIVGSQWLWLTRNGHQIPLPLGLFIGVGFAFHEHFQIDRKIEYAVLLVAMLVGYWTQAGLFWTV